VRQLISSPQQPRLLSDQKFSWFTREINSKVSLVIYVIFQVDIQLETGEYFMSDKKKSAKKWQERQEKQAEKTAENKRKRDQSFIPPKVFCCFTKIYVMHIAL
jgi:hypothetical protein